MNISQQRKDSVIELCRELVRTPSLSGHEQDVANLVENAMRSLGYDEVRRDRYGNVVGRVQGNRGHKKILFEAHMDHVDIGERSAWTRDPYGGVLEGDRIYGRGTSDMKGSLAAMIVAGACLAREFRSELDGEVLVAASVHEECFEGTASAEIGQTYRPDYVVIGEASGLDLKRGQRGRAEIKLETYGKSAHSSHPEAGSNAVKKMVRALSAIEGEFRPPVHEVLGPGILELTDIISHPYPGASVVPDRCTVTFDRRLLVGETEEQVLEAVRAIMDRAGVDDRSFRVSIAEGADKCYTGEPIRARRFIPAWLLDENHEFVYRAMSGLRAAGLNPKLSHYSFCTNGSYYAGVAGIPTLGFGPSHENLAHIVDEYVEVDQLIGAANGFCAIALSALSTGTP